MLHQATDCLEPVATSSRRLLVEDLLEGAVVKQSKPEIAELFSKLFEDSASILLRADLEFLAKGARLIVCDDSGVHRARFGSGRTYLPRRFIGHCSLVGGHELGRPREAGEGQLGTPWPTQIEPLSPMPIDVLMDVAR